MKGFVRTIIIITLFTLCIGISKAQPIQIEGKIWKHYFQKEKQTTYIRFEGIPTPSGEEIHIIQMWVLDHKIGKCRYLPNSAEWIEGNTILIGDTKIPWEYNYDLKEDKLYLQNQFRKRLVEYEQAKLGFNPWEYCGDPNQT